MPCIAKIVFSDDHLVRHGQAWPGVPLLLVDGLLEFEASEWALDLKIRGCSENTQVSYVKTMGIWMSALASNGLNWRSAGSDAAERFVAMLTREGSAASTVRLRMTHVQEFYRWAWAKKYIAEIPFEIHAHRPKRSKSAMEAASLRLAPRQARRVKPQTQVDFDKVLASGSRQSSALTLRDELIAEAARYMGLRRSEVAALRTDQFTFLNPSDEVHALEIVSAKSGRLDTVLAPRLFVEKVQRFIATQRTAMVDKIAAFDPSYAAPPNVFLTERGKRRGQAVTGDYIGDSWRRSSTAAGLDTRFHDNRSSFGTNAAKAAREAGADARIIVKELLRHKQQSTSEIYVKFDEIQSDLLLRARLVNDAYFAKAADSDERRDEQS